MLYNILQKQKVENTDSLCSMASMLLLFNPIIQTMVFSFNCVRKTDVLICDIVFL